MWWSFDWTISKHPIHPDFVVDKNPDKKVSLTVLKVQLYPANKNKTKLKYLLHLLPKPFLFGGDINTHSCSWRMKWNSPRVKNIIENHCTKIKKINIFNTGDLAYLGSSNIWIKLFQTNFQVLYGDKNGKFPL